MPTRAKAKGLHTPMLGFGLPNIPGSLLSVMLVLVLGGCSSVATTQPLSATTDGSPAAPAATQRPMPTLTPSGSIASETLVPEVLASVTPSPPASDSATPLLRAPATSSQQAIQF